MLEALYEKAHIAKICDDVRPVKKCWLVFE